MNERTYQGKKVAFMEELQSDWAREGRAKGFLKEPEPVKNVGEFRKELAQETLDNVRSSGYEHTINEDGTLTLYHKTTPLAKSNIERNGFSSDSFFADSAESAETLASTNKKGGSVTMEIKVEPSSISFNQGTYEFEASGKLKKGSDGIYRVDDKYISDSYELNPKPVIQTGVPNNPLLKNWQEPTVKRALQEAVKDNADYFSWISGEQTSARYNLATYLKEVKWVKSNLKDVKNIGVYTKEGKDIAVNIDKNGIIFDTEKAEWQGKKLDEVLGKGLADKIMEKETGTLSGEGLKFGGEWETV